ncbi:hypothetical protein EON65_50155 [archaeon]|nr:MAG: hypothetical protein EON65_50155 [archaeon]
MKSSWNTANSYPASHEAEPLLTDNETYISAIQRASVSLYHLGFRDQRLPSATSNIGEPVLKAVLPKDNQVEFLESIDRGLKFLAQTHKKSSSRRKHYDKQGITGLHERSPLQRKVDELYPKKNHKPNPFRYGQIPHYATPSQRTKEVEKQELDDEENRRKHRKHMEMLTKQLDIIQDGVKYNYDPLTGKLIPHTDYKKSVAKLKKMATAKSMGIERPKSDAMFKGLILEKTSRHVEALRKTIQEVGFTLCSFVCAWNYC